MFCFFTPIIFLETVSRVVPMREIANTVKRDSMQSVRFDA